MNIKNSKIGFLGIGTMGFPMSYNLSKNGFSLILPTFRMEIDANSGFSPLVPDYETKLHKINEMLSGAANESKSLEDLIKRSDIILISMPTSKEVEELVLAQDGILANARKGAIVIDMTSADPVSTQKLSRLLEERDIEMLDAPVSGGVSGAINQSLSVMVGGKTELFEICIPILETIGQKEKVVHVGPIGAGHTLKAANNFLSSCCLVATMEAIMVAVKAGISAQKAIEVISGSGGKSDASINKFPNCVFPNKKFNFTLNLMGKDIDLFTKTAKELKVPAFISNILSQLWKIPIAKGQGDEDLMNIIQMYEDWCGETIRGIAS